MKAKYLSPRPEGNEELSTIFSDMVKQLEQLIKWSVRRIAPAESFDDYYQEALIYAWGAFQRDYYGFMDPTRPIPAGVGRMTWKTWFVQYCRYGAIEYWHKCHPKRHIRQRSFCQFNESFDTCDPAEEYNFAGDAVIEKMEGIISSMPSRYSNALIAFRECDFNVNETVRRSDLAYNNSGFTELQWSLSVLKHILYVETDPRLANKFEAITIGEAFEYVCNLYISCIVNPVPRAQTVEAFRLIRLAVENIGLSKQAMFLVRAEDYIALILELKKPEYRGTGKPIVFKRRIGSILDLLCDLRIIDQNILRGTNLDVTKEPTLVGRTAWKRPSRRTIPLKAKEEVIYKKTSADILADKRIVCLDKNGAVIYAFDDFGETASLGFDPMAVRMVLGGARKMHKGYSWAYAPKQILPTQNLQYA